MQVAAIMVIGLVPLVEQDRFGAGGSSGGTGRARLEPGQPFVSKAGYHNGPINKEIPIGLEIGMELQAEQSLFTTGGESGRKIEIYRLGRICRPEVCDYADHAGLLQ